MTQKRISDITESLESGSRPKGGVSSEGGDVPSIGGEHIATDGGFRLDALKRVSHEFFGSMRTGHVKFDDILIVKDGATTGRTSYVSTEFPFREAAVNEHVFCLRIDREKAHAKFVFHYLRSPAGQAGVMSDFRGATVGGISRDFINKVKLVLPSIKEQQRVAAILDQADAIRAKRRAALTQLANLAQSSFIEMFGDPVRNPIGWEPRTLDQLTTKLTDGEHLNPAFSGVGMPIVMAGNVLDDWVDIEAAKKVAYALGLQFRKKCGPDLGDLLMVSRGATIGRLCRVHRSDVFCLMGSVILVKPDRSVIDERFLSGMLALPTMQAMLYKVSGSSAQQAIYLKDLKKLICPLPPLQLQQAFARRVEALESLQATHRAALVELDALIASLQYQAFHAGL